MKFHQFIAAFFTAFVVCQIGLYSVAMAAAPDATYAIQIGTLVQDAVGFVFVGLGVLITWLITSIVQKIEKKTGLEIDQHVRDYLHPAIDRALEYGKAKAVSYAGDIRPFKTRNEVVAHAANYLIDNARDALEHFGLTEVTLDAYLQSRLEADAAELKQPAEA